MLRVPAHASKLLLVAVIIAALLPTVGASARPIRPTITSLYVSQRTVPSAGGDVRVTARVQHTSICRFIGFPGYASVKKLGCKSGRVTALFKVGANVSQTKRTWNSYLELRGDDGMKLDRYITVTQLSAPAKSPAAPSAPVPPVQFLDACDPGPHCFYGPIYDTYPAYGNVAPVVLGDCTFAAAANWQQIVLGKHPDATQIGFEFADAGGTEQGGLPQNTLWSYWRQHGIAGLHLTALRAIYRDQTNVENGVRYYGAMIVEFQFAQGTGFGPYTEDAGLHDAVVDGFTPDGPLVVSWGQTLQLTWDQWNNEAVGMWAIGAS
jgi:hypothetical protein